MESSWSSGNRLVDPQNGGFLGRRWRYTADGTLDSTFPEEGRFVAPPTARTGAPHRRRRALDRGRIGPQRERERRERHDPLDDSGCVLTTRASPPGSRPRAARPDVRRRRVRRVAHAGGDRASRSIALAADGSAVVRFERLNGEQGVVRVSIDGNVGRSVEFDDLNLVGFAGRPGYRRAEWNGRCSPRESTACSGSTQTYRRHHVRGQRRRTDRGSRGGRRTCVAHDATIVAAADARRGAGQPIRRAAFAAAGLGRRRPGRDAGRRTSRAGSSRSWLLQSRSARTTTRTTSSTPRRLTCATCA